MQPRFYAIVVVWQQKQNEVCNVFHYPGVIKSNFWNQNSFSNPASNRFL